MDQLGELDAAEEVLRLEAENRLLKSERDEAREMVYGENSEVNLDEYGQYDPFAAGKDYAVPPFVNLKKADAAYDNDKTKNLQPPFQQYL